MTTISSADLPELVVSRALGRGADEWLAGLPQLVRDLEHEWTMQLGRIFSGGSEALVAEVTLDDGTAAVLKLLLPGSEHGEKNEIAVLRAADGDGCARLLRYDLERDAMLLERLGPPLTASSLTRDERVEILVTAAERLWRHAPGAAFPTAADKGRSMVDFIAEKWEEHGRPCSRRALDYAIGCAERRIAAHDDGRAVLVHGDIHEGNAVESADGYKLIDPAGLLAEPEYDLGLIMREDTIDPADPRGVARRLAERTRLDETAIWEWAAAQWLSTGLVQTGLNDQPTGRELLANAELAAQTGA